MENTKLSKHFSLGEFLNVEKYPDSMSMVTIFVISVKNIYEMETIWWFVWWFRRKFVNLHPNIEILMH